MSDELERVIEVFTVEIAQTEGQELDDILP
jgi:hypothetical protein